MEKTRIGIVVFDNVEVLDFCGPFEVFSVTRLDEDVRYQTSSPFEILLVSEHDEAVCTTGGMKVLPNCTFSNCAPLNVLIVPGGLGARVEIDNPVILDWICKRATEVQTLASVCTGAMLLGKAGLLSGLCTTTHWRYLDWMTESFPEVKVNYSKHFIRDGNVYTSAGISAGIDMSLMIVADYFGGEISRATAKYMEYPYPENDKRRVPILAPNAP